MSSAESSKHANPLDPVNKVIIEELQLDGRVSYAAISKVVGLSEAAVRARVQRLVDTGVIQIIAVTNPVEMGFARQAMVGIKVSGPTDPVADALEAMSEVDYVVITAGSYDILVEVVCESDAHLATLVGSQIRSIPGVLTTETHVYLELRKQTYSWGVK